MTHYYWSDWYTGWGWVLWFGMIFLAFTSWGNWGYTYTAHRKFRDLMNRKDAVDILAERYAKGDIQRDEFHKMKDEILSLKRVRETQQLRT